MILLPLVEEQFASEIKLCYQKRDSLYQDLVTVKHVPVGDSTYFNRFRCAKTPKLDNGAQNHRRQCHNGK